MRVLHLCVVPAHEVQAPAQVDRLAQVERGEVPPQVWKHNVCRQRMACATARQWGNISRDRNNKLDDRTLMNTHRT